MYNMAKPKAGNTHHTKRTVSTNAMFNSSKPTRAIFKGLEKGARDMSKIADMKLEIERANKISIAKPCKIEKSTKQRKPKQRPMHSLAAAFSGKSSVSMALA